MSVLGSLCSGNCWVLDAAVSSGFTCNIILRASFELVPDGGWYETSSSAICCICCGGSNRAQSIDCAGLYGLCN